MYLDPFDEWKPNRQLFSIGFIAGTLDMGSFRVICVVGTLIVNGVKNLPLKLKAHEQHETWFIFFKRWSS